MKKQKQKKTKRSQSSSLEARNRKPCNLGTRGLWNLFKWFSYVDLFREGSSVLEWCISIRPVTSLNILWMFKPHFICIIHICELGKWVCWGLDHMTIMAAPPFKNLLQNRIVIVLVNLFGNTECPRNSKFVQMKAPVWLLTCLHKTSNLVHCLFLLWFYGPVNPLGSCWASQFT